MVYMLPLYFIRQQHTRVAGKPEKKQSNPKCMMYVHGATQIHTQHIEISRTYTQHIQCMRFWFVFDIATTVKREGEK